MDGGYDLGSALGCDMWRLDLSQNQLSGVIPPSLVNMQQLKDLNLGDNTFSGTIPSEFDTMPELKYFRFARNQLSGKTRGKPAPQGNSLCWVKLTSFEAQCVWHV